MSTYITYSDAQLIYLMKKGEEGAFAVLYARVQPYVYHYALRICKQTEATEEIVQNVMLKVWQWREQIDTEQNFRGWLARVTANEAFDFLKRLAREQNLQEKVWQHMQEAKSYSEDQYVLKEYLRLVDEAVNTLPPQQQKIYRMSREDELTYEEIAQALDISPHTVRNHIASALQHIRAYMKKNTASLLPPLVAACIFAVAA